MNQEVTFSFDQLLSLATEGYALEASMLAKVADSKHFKSLLSRFGDYPKFMREGRGRVYDYEVVRLCSRDGLGSIIDATESSEVLTELLSCAHLAASCYLFAGSSFTYDQLNQKALNGKAKAVMRRILGDSPRNVRKLLHNLHNTDAIRTVHLLKLAGLLDIHYKNCRQLSLGAGHGSRDLASIHHVPVITSSKGRSATSISGPQAFMFNSYCLNPKDVILSDNDPGLKDYFEELNKKPGSGIRVIHEDTYEALQKTPELLAKYNLDLRNLVVVFRIDPRMLSDLTEFFRLLSLLIVDGADFVLSIGAGHNLGEFRSRLDKIIQISNFLNEKGIKTTRLRLYRGGSAEEKRSNPAFGSVSFATYEILHCKLVKKKLAV